MSQKSVSDSTTSRHIKSASTIFMTEFSPSISVSRSFCFINSMLIVGINARSKVQKGTMISLLLSMILKAHWLSSVKNKMFAVLVPSRLEHRIRTAYSVKNKSRSLNRGFFCAIGWLHRCCTTYRITRSFPNKKTYFTRFKNQIPTINYKVATGLIALFPNSNHFFRWQRAQVTRVWAHHDRHVAAVLRDANWVFLTGVMMDELNVQRSAVSQVAIATRTGHESLVRGRQGIYTNWLPYRNFLYINLKIYQETLRNGQVYDSHSRGQ